MTAERAWVGILLVAAGVDVLLHRRGLELLSTAARRHRLLVGALALHLLLDPKRWRARRYAEHSTDLGGTAWRRD